MQQAGTQGSPQVMVLPCGTHQGLPTTNRGTNKHEEEDHLGDPPPHGCLFHGWLLIDPDVPCLPQDLLDSADDPPLLAELCGATSAGRTVENILCRQAR